MDKQQESLRFVVGQRVVTQAEDFDYGHSLTILEVNPNGGWDYLVRDSVFPNVKLYFMDDELEGVG